MIFKFNQPSLAAIQAKFIVERLANFPISLGNVNIFVTGRTGSGKTTLGNRLSRLDYLMASSGHQDCTNEINLLKFPIGLNYFDLPGVCSDDRLENYNRAALGLEQVKHFPLVDNVTLVQYIKNPNSHKENFSVNEFTQQQFKPDIIFYLIASDKQLLRDDCIYLQDLLKHHHQIIYILNTFTSKQANDSSLATSENITDIVNKIHKVHTSTSEQTSQPEIVKINCWTGEGITELMTSVRQILGRDKARLFDELIDYQKKKASVEFSYQVKQEILRLAAHIACQKPVNASDQYLYDVCNNLWEFIATLLGRSREITSCVQELMNTQAHLAINKSTINYYEKVKQKKSKAIYQSVPIFKTISEQVPDYNNPIQEKRKVWVETSNVFKGMANMAKYGKYGKRKKVYEVVGYHTKTVTRQVVDRYEEEYSHTEYWEEETGEVMVGTSYSYFGYSTVSLLLTLAHLMTSEIIDNSEKLQDNYKSLYKTISNKVDKLPSFPTEPQEKEILSILGTEVDRLFDTSFNFSR